MRYRFPYVGADLRKLVQQPGIQRTLRDHGYGLVYHAICLFTVPAFAGYSFRFPKPAEFHSVYFAKTLQNAVDKDLRRRKTTLALERAASRNKLHIETIW